MISVDLQTGLHKLATASGTNVGRVPIPMYFVSVQYYSDNNLPPPNPAPTLVPLQNLTSTGMPAYFRGVNVPVNFDQGATPPGGKQTPKVGSGSPPSIIGTGGPEYNFGGGNGIIPYLVG